MKINLISFTQNGSKVSNELIDLFENKDYDIYAVGKYPFGKIKALNKSVYEFCKDSFETKADAIIIIGALGIAVRAIAGNLKNKGCDPAVIVIDDKKNFVIPVISGHIGGANALSMIIAESIGAIPVITTATDVNKKFAIDSWAVENGCSIADISKIKYVSSAILRGEDVGLICDFPIEGKLPKGLKLGNMYKVGICISTCDKKISFKNTLNLIPKEYVIDIQFKENVPYDDFKDTIDRILDDEKISPLQIIAVSSEGLKCENIHKYCIEKKIELTNNKANEILRYENINEAYKYRENGNKKIFIKECICDNIKIAISKINWRCIF